MITVSKEDYLKSILEAESEGEDVISARLADMLKVSPPAVTMALRRLKKDGLVRVQGDGQVRLTATGRKIARKLTLRHHLIERMLAELFGMEWWKAHDEAERLEHAVSPDFEANRGLVLLADAEPGQTYAVSGIYERDRHLLQFLEARGIRPKAKFRLLERNYDKTLSIRTATGAVVLGRPAAERIWVSLAPQS